MKTNASLNGAADASATPPPGDRARLVDHVELTCEAMLGRGTVTIGALDRLEPGDIVTLDASPADLAELHVDGKVIARGEIVTVDDRFAVRLTEIG